MTAIQTLGQTGYRLQHDATVLFIDPYLSDSVREREGDHLVRLQPIAIDPAGISDADYVLVTHEHLDHCDPDTLLPIATASPGCRFLAPPLAVETMVGYGIPRERIDVAAVDSPQQCGAFSVRTVPGAHPTLETDADGNYCRVGYVIEIDGKRLYHAGDTGVHETIVAALQAIGDIDIGMIPVNEQNFYRDRAGIIGNMSVREAFQFAAEIGVHTLVPTHWDMFASNQVYREEIELLYAKLQPPFEMVFAPETF